MVNDMLQSKYLQSATSSPRFSVITLKCSVTVATQAENICPNSWCSFSHFFFSQLKSVCLKTMLVFLTSVMLTGPAKWQVKMNQSWTRPNYFGFAEWLTKDALTTSLGTWVKLHIIMLLWTDSISECTVCRSLKQMGYRRANRVPLLSAQIRKMKLQFG